MPDDFTHLQAKVFSPLVHGRRDGRLSFAKSLGALGTPTEEAQVVGHVHGPSSNAHFRG